MIPEVPSKRETPVLTTQLILGVAVIVIGVLFTLDNLDVLEARRYLPFWPILFLAIGISNVLTARETPQRAFGWLLSLMGLLLLLDVWGLANVGLWDLWPLVLVFWGGMIVWRGLSGATFYADRSPSRADSRSSFSASAFLSGFDRTITAEGFCGGEVNAFMGGGKIDLTRAHMEIGESAVVNISALMGGLEIRIPNEWAVDNRVTYFMGGSNDRSRLPGHPSAPRLVLKGFVMMGGVEIKN
jgi:hypothetical protein